ncbi:transcription initiation factor TFIID subunit 4b-like [Salvia divinorum]|uniref:Transcription initiation factor TFIID subunit 4b-like n=1 Tax=Salvia divinorum TaxID=28513 RepID=A0ABD1FQU4_SALDI
MIRDMEKFLDEDEDETAHSAADVEAYAAGLSRVLEGDTSTSQQLCDSNAGSSAASGHAGIATFQSGQHIMSVGDNSSHAPSSTIASPHMASSSRQPDTRSQSKNQIPVARLVSIIRPQLDHDRALRLQTLCCSLKKREISTNVFGQRMASLVGSQMIRMAILNLQHMTHMNRNIAMLQNQAQRPSSTSGKQKTTVSPSMTHSSAQLHPLTATVGTQNKSKVPPKKPPLAGQKKPMKACGSLPPSSKKQKVSESLADQFQSIEHLNDVTAVNGFNLREEEEQLFSGFKEDNLVSEAARQIEEKLILQKVPLQNKMMEIMAKSGLKNMTSWQWRNLERCLSLAVEERMHRILSTAIRFSKQRVDKEKTGLKITVTSDVQKEIMAINRKAREEWEKKQAENDKSQKLKELHSKESKDIDADKKNKKRGKSTKVNMDEVDKMHAKKAANLAAGAATGINDITSRWKLMIEAKQKEGESHTSSGPHTNRDVRRKPLASSTTSTRDQAVIPRVARTISVKDVLGVLEREPQMSKSALLYRLYLSQGGPYGLVPQPYS